MLHWRSESLCNHLRCLRSSHESRERLPGLNTKHSRWIPLDAIGSSGRVLSNVHEVHMVSQIQGRTRKFGGVIVEGVDIVPIASVNNRRMWVPHTRYWGLISRIHDAINETASAIVAWECLRIVVRVVRDPDFDTFQKFEHFVLTAALRKGEAPFYELLNGDAVLQERGGGCADVDVHALNTRANRKEKPTVATKRGRVGLVVWSW